MGEILRANLGGEVNESVVVFDRCAVLVGSFLCQSSLRLAMCKKITIYVFLRVFDSKMNFHI